MKRALLVLMALFYLLAGSLHFVVPAVYVQIMPTYIPAPWDLVLVYLSGAAEAGLGALLLWPRATRLAAFGIIALLIAVFPANLDMALHPRAIVGAPRWLSETGPLALWGRLPFQLVFIWWAYPFTRPARRT